MRRFAVIALVVVAVACGRAPRALVAGSDACDYCRMAVSDVRFGGEVESTTGVIHVFDAVECLASYYLDAAARSDVRRAWVTDFESGRFVPVDSAVFIRDGSINSPMGRALFALAPEVGPEQRRQYGGTIASWIDVLEMMRVRGLQPGATPHDTADIPPE